MRDLLWFTLTLTAITVSASHVTFEASPRVLKENVTEELNMSCSVTNEQGQIDHISSIYIIKDGTEAVASLTAGGPRVIIDTDHLVAIGSLTNGSREGELVLSWGSPGLEELGECMCKVMAVDARGHILTLTSSLTLTYVEPSISDVMGEIQRLTQENRHQQQVNEQQRQKNEQQREDIQTLTQEIRQQQTEISKLQSCSSTHVAFQAAMSFSRFSNNRLTIPNGQVVVWDDVTLNQGGGYDGSTGHFTCTVPGVYVFNVHVLGSQRKQVNLQLEKNGREMVDLHKSSGVNFVDASLSHVVDLQSGDVVRVGTGHTSWGPSVLVQGPAGSHVARTNYFSGHLVSPARCTA